MSKTPLTDALVSELASGTAAEVLQRNWVTPLMNHARDLECKLAEVCQCSMRTKLVGDGCEVCNPKLAKELSADDKRVLYENLWELTDGTAESSSATPTRPPMTDEEINNGMDKSMLTLAETVAFAAGVRYAEQVHRIGEEE